MTKRWQQSELWWASLIILIVLLGVKWQHNIDHYYRVDFAAYWSAGRALNEGVDRYSYIIQDEEGNNFKHAMFLNPPVVAHPFRLIGWLPYGTAKTVWYYVQLLLFIFCVTLLTRNKQEKLVLLTVTIVGMPFIFWPLFAELERGETNMLLLLAVCLSYYWWRREKYVWSGIILGLGSVLKFPLLLLFAIPLALRQNKLLVAGGMTFATIFLVSLVVDGVVINKTYFVDYLPGIALKDQLPDEVFSRQDTPQPPTTRWEGKTYITRYRFGAPSGSAARFFRSWSGNRLDRSLIVGGATITALAILAGAWRRRRLGLMDRENRLWEDMAWSVVVMATLILHTLSWITNYVMFIFVVLLLWRFVFTSVDRMANNVLKIGLLVGTVAIVIGDPLLAWLPNLGNGVDIAIRNRVWLGGMLIWGILLVWLVNPRWLVGESSNDKAQILNK